VIGPRHNFFKSILITSYTCPIAGVVEVHVINLITNRTL
jgi:hypothetical protein